MLNCIIATMRPKSGMKRPSTPASFICRRIVSGEFFEVRTSRNSRVASAAERMADQAQAPVGEALGVRVDREIVPVGEPEQPDQVDGIALEGILGPQVHPAAIEPEIL